MRKLLLDIRELLSQFIYDPASNCSQPSSEVEAMIRRIDLMLIEWPENVAK